MGCDVQIHNLESVKIEEDTTNLEEPLESISVEEEMEINPEYYNEIEQPAAYLEVEETKYREFSEPIFDANAFKGDSSRSNQAIQALTPPPKFQDIVQNCPQNIVSTFEQQLHGKLVGVWPIRTAFLLKNLKH